MTEILDDDVLVVPDELTTLKARADQLGITYHPSIGIEKLREKINAAITSSEEDTPVEATDDVAATEESAQAKRVRLKKEAAELIRIRVVCMNPAKKEWNGEIITAGNSAVGTFKKYIPFNADEGWHVPRIIYNQLVARECQVFTNGKNARGQTIRVGKLIKEFAVEVLPTLTEKELKELARRQAMAKSVD